MAEEKKAPAQEYDTKSRKRLEIQRVTSKYQKEWFMQLKSRVEAGEPLAWGTATVPEEFLCAMDIPFVCNQWWTAICAAKQMGTKFYDFLRTNGYRNDMCSYCSTAYACALDPEPENGPWGGLPKPTVLLSFDPRPVAKKIDALCAEKWGVPMFSMPTTPNRSTNKKEWEVSANKWEELIDPEGLELRIQDHKRMIEFLEKHTGKKFSMEKLKEALDYSNEQNRWYGKLRDLIASTHPAPVTVPDTIGAVMQAQWHRGTKWGAETAKAIYDEVKAMVDEGKSTVPNEQVRMMWLGRGLWFNMAFYQGFEEKYGASFIWSQYLAFGADKYVRNYDGGRDPIAALSTRFCGGGDTGLWYLKEAKLHDIDGVVYLISNENCMNNGQFAEGIIEDLEKAGYPVLVLKADPADSKKWNQETMNAAVSEFLETRILPKKGLKPYF